MLRETSFSESKSEGALIARAPSLIALQRTALPRSRHNIQPEIDVAEVDTIADHMDAPHKRNRMVAGPKRDKDAGRVKRRRRPVKADLLRRRRLRDVDDPQAIGVPTQVEGRATDLWVVRGIEGVGL